MYKLFIRIRNTFNLFFNIRLHLGINKGKRIFLESTIFTYAVSLGVRFTKEESFCTQSEATGVTWSGFCLWGLSLGTFEVMKERK